VRVKRTLFHLPDALVPAYYVELMAPDQAYSYVVDATDGHLLFRHDIMAFDNFSYRAWVEAPGVGLPHDGPQGTSPTPHPTGLPDNFAPAFIAPVLRTLQNGPISTNDPWLAPGSTVTTGNNVDAYADLVTPDGFSAGDLRATTTSANTFDRTYDVNQAPTVSNDQRMAAITQLFYNNNFFHDWYYDSGFNEASGNGQTNNFGRGGLGNDAMRSEAQDFGGTNNANMSTPADGAPGRMQMYLFTPAGAAAMTVSAPAGVAGTYATGVATGFGPQTFNVSGSLLGTRERRAGLRQDRHDRPWHVFVPAQSSKRPGRGCDRHHHRRQRRGHGATRDRWHGGWRHDPGRVRDARDRERTQSRFALEHRDTQPGAAGLDRPGRLARQPDRGARVGAFHQQPARGQRWRPVDEHGRRSG
jgi:hypothetical protein